ncbi:hypothetical protein [Aeromicrobium wangtongii]|uniref:hypothetical protein n=1 Tax=Aeromicrobium wangtongii TaxID=2969247 RepID=UPI0020180117|nr:hypothetical protein [Aeromicrobium wangtongii]MCL3819208.1 hypothetical protein [Aeromicrobium wangtongii]
MRNRKIARTAGVLAASAGLIFGTTTAATAEDLGDLGPGWAPPVCEPKEQVQFAPFVTTMWYPTGGVYSAGHGIYTFRVKAVTSIGGVPGEPIEGTTYCSPN